MYAMKTRTLLLIALLLACGLSLPAQQRVQLTHFEGLPITGLKAGVSQVELRQGEPTGLTIDIDETLLPHLICEMNDGVVQIGLKKPMQRNWFNGKKEPLIKAVLTVDQLNYLSLSDMSSVAGARGSSRPTATPRSLFPTCRKSACKNSRPTGSACAARI